MAVCGERGASVLPSLPGLPAEHFLPCDFEAPYFSESDTASPAETEAKVLGISQKPGPLQKLLPKCIWQQLELKRRRRARSCAVARALSVPQDTLEGGAKLGIEFVVYGEEPTPASLPSHPCWFEDEVDRWYRYNNRGAHEKERAAQAIAHAKRMRAQQSGRMSPTPSNLFSGLQATGVGDDEWEQAEHAAGEASTER